MWNEVLRDRYLYKSIEGDKCIIVRFILWTLVWGLGVSCWEELLFLFASWVDIKVKTEVIFQWLFYFERFLVYGCFVLIYVLWIQNSPLEDHTHLIIFKKNLKLLKECVIYSYV